MAPPHVLVYQIRSFQVKHYKRNYRDELKKTEPSVPPFKVSRTMYLMPHANGFPLLFIMAVGQKKLE